MEDELALPHGFVLVRTTPAFDERSVPTGLLHRHQVAAGVWGRLVVRSGSVDVVFDDRPLDPRHGAPGKPILIPPERVHHVVTTGPVGFVVEFYRAPTAQP